MMDDLAVRNSRGSRDGGYHFACSSEPRDSFGGKEKRKRKETQKGITGIKTRDFGFGCMTPKTNQK
jgi:hypothetical protein